jgi:hypothetical protein
MQDGWADTSLMDADGPFKGISVRVPLPALPDVTAISSTLGQRLDVAVKSGFDAGGVSFSGSGTGYFDKDLSLWDVNLSVQGKLDLKSKYGDFSKLGLGSGGSLSVSGDKATTTITLGGQKIDIDVNRGTVEDDIRRAFDEVAPGVTANPAVDAAIKELANQVLEPALAGVYQEEQALRADLREAYWKLLRVLETQGKSLPQPYWPEPEPEIKCFARQTPIAMGDGSFRMIEDIRAGDTVLSFDPTADHGRGALVPRRVTRLYHNTTTEWVRLSWTEDGEARELIATPGHHMLDQYGRFPRLDAMLREGRATVVLASGALAEVLAERIVYSAATAHLFERAQSALAIAGNAALKPAPVDAWATYNFEVEELHTYVAGGVRVHNDSGALGALGNAIDDGLDAALGGKDHDGSVRDILTDAATLPFHAAGEIIDGLEKFANKFGAAVGDMFRNIASGEAFRPVDMGGTSRTDLWHDPMGTIGTLAQQRFSNEQSNSAPAGWTWVPNGGGAALVDKDGHRRNRHRLDMINES